MTSAKIDALCGYCILHQRFMMCRAYDNRTSQSIGAIRIAKCDTKSCLMYSNCLGLINGERLSCCSELNICYKHTTSLSVQSPAIKAFFVLPYRQPQINVSTQLSIISLWCTHTHNLTHCALNTLYLYRDVSISNHSMTHQDVYYLNKDNKRDDRRLF